MNPGDPCNCDVCIPDSRLTCSYAGEDVSVEAIYLANAYRGNLILCPGGDNGAIGGLLHQLSPPQHYSHMGIMVADHDLIRHSTASPGRLNSDEYYSGSILGVSAPTDGLNADHLQWAWPGSITQSAEQAYFADHYGDLSPPGYAGGYQGANLVDSESPSSKSYRIAALSFDGVWDGGAFFPALVVKPCPVLETAEITGALNRVADQAMAIFAHYRFYCYTNGAIGDDPNYSGPPWTMTDPQPDWDAAALKWKDWSNPGDVKWTAAPQATIPAVCSSIVWQAVRNANLAGSPKIHLDWAATQADALGEAGGRCRRELQPDWSGDNRDDFTLDGLYFYDEASRSKAASWLNDHLSQQVYDGLKQALGDKGGAMKIIADAIDDVGRGSFIAAAEAGTASLMALLTPLVGPVVAGILDAIMAEQLIELLYDMPDDIANQVCNSFAFDCHRGFPGDTHCVDAVGNEIRDIDSTNWSDAPGVGRAVSPDNIHMFWDAPNPSGSPKIVQGLYGYNTPVQLVAAVVRRPKCVCKKSTGTATIKGFVRMNGKPVAGAYVKVNCQHTISTTKPGYSLTVQSGGQYKVVARYEDPATGLVMYGERTTDPDITPGQVISSFDITVISPPTCLRNVIVGGTVRVDDVGTFGADHAETPFTTTLHVQYGVATFNEAKGEWDVDPDDPAAIARRSDVARVGASTGDANGQLKIEVTANKGLDVDVTVTGTIGDLSHQAVKNVPDGATVTIDEFDLDTGGPFNDRAYFRGITITNIPAQAI